MSGDENGKTALGIQGPQKETRASAAAATASGASLADSVSRDERPPFASVEHSEHPPDETQNLRAADSSLAESNSGVGDFEVKTNSSSPPARRERAKSTEVLAAESSVGRRLDSGPVLGVSSLDSLDWDLGDEYDVPSEFDEVMTARAPKSEPSSQVEHSGSLPSASELFGPGYRSRSDDESLNERTLLFAGDSGSSLLCELPEVEPIKASGEAETSQGELSSPVLAVGEYEVISGTAPNSEALGVDVIGEWQTEELPESLNGPGGDEVVARPGGDAAVAARCPDGFSNVIGSGSAVAQSAKAPELSISAPVVHHSAELPPKRPRGVLIEPATVGSVTPEDQEIPLISTGFVGNTRSLPSETVATRGPSAGAAPYLRRPNVKERSFGGRLILLTLAGFLFIGLIATALTYFR